MHLHNIRHPRRVKPLLKMPTGDSSSAANAVPESFYFWSHQKWCKRVLQQSIIKGKCSNMHEVHPSTMYMWVLRHSGGGAGTLHSSKTYNTDDCRSIGCRFRISTKQPTLRGEASEVDRNTMFLLSWYPYTPASSPSDSEAASSHAFFT